MSCAESISLKLALLDLQAASTSDEQPVRLHASHLFGAEPNVDGGRAQSAGGICQPHRAAGHGDAIGCQHAASADQKAAGLHGLIHMSQTVSG